jgi:heme-degrading monooxygenase HmoA
MRSSHREASLWNPDEYAMITVWEDEHALAAFAGEEWHKAVIPPGMEKYPISFSVDHFHIKEMANKSNAGPLDRAPDSPR